jgi:hypothetical protein
MVGTVGEDGGDKNDGCCLREAFGGRKKKE